MKRIYLTSLLIFYSIILFTQGKYISGYPETVQSDSNNSNISQDEVVYTPFGPTFKSMVHYIESDQYLQLNDNYFEIIHYKTNNIEHRFKSKANESNTVIRELIADSDQQEGWITYADCQIYIHDPKPTYFSTEWVVPSPPINISKQTIFLFNGLVGYRMSDSLPTITLILQPVLQWGKSAAGGGEYWAICNWLVTNEGLYFHDSLIKVNSGDRLEGVIKLIPNSDTSYNYNSSFTGYLSGLDVFNLPKLMNPYVALEAYRTYDCNEYPPDEKIRMYNIQILIDSIYPPVIWRTYNMVDDCGQFTNIIDDSPNGGEVNIHFHKPFSEDNYEDIYIYPNPVGNIIHFSITDPVYNCRIEVYNNLGNLLLTENYKTLEYEYSLNIKNYAPGIYYVKIYYQKDKISWETNHTFKFIKTNR